METHRKLHEIADRLNTLLHVLITQQRGGPVPFIYTYPFQGTAWYIRSATPVSADVIELEAFATPDCQRARATLPISADEGLTIVHTLQRIADIHLAVRVTRILVAYPEAVVLQLNNEVCVLSEEAIPEDAHQTYYTDQQQRSLHHYDAVLRDAGVHARMGTAPCGVQQDRLCLILSH